MKKKPKLDFGPTKEEHGWFYYALPKTIIPENGSAELIGKKFINVDREKLNIYPGPSLNLIMNGWFMENSKNWPPTKNIKPLIISFHLNPTAKKKMLSSSGIEYFKKHEPIGCRVPHHLRDLYLKEELRHTFLAV